MLVLENIFSMACMTQSSSTATKNNKIAIISDNWHWTHNYSMFLNLEIILIKNIFICLEI